MVRGAWIVKWRGIPLLKADFGFGTFITEEEHVIFCDEWREIGGVLEVCWKVTLLIANPAKSLVCHRSRGHWVWQDGLQFS